MRTQVVNIAQAQRRPDWEPTGDGRFAGSDLIDAAIQPDAKMTVGFGRIADGESMQASFPYDEVMVVITGAITIQDECGETFTATPGNVVYMPAGTTNTYTFDNDVEIAYIAHPPSVYAEHAAQQTGR